MSTPEMNAAIVGLLVDPKTNLDNIKTYEKIAEAADTDTVSEDQIEVLKCQHWCHDKLKEVILEAFEYADEDDHSFLETITDAFQESLTDQTGNTANWKGAAGIGCVSRDEADLVFRLEPSKVTMRFWKVEEE